jgi:hypothetical protein
VTSSPSHSGASNARASSSEELDLGHDQAAEIAS